MSSKVVDTTGYCLIAYCSGSKRKTEEPDAADSLMFLNIEGMVEEWWIWVICLYFLDLIFNDICLMALDQLDNGLKILFLLSRIEI